MQLNKGDIVLSRNPMRLGLAINAVQKFWSVDDASKYSHALIIVNEIGTTLEALWTVKNQNLFEDYKDAELIIGRNSKLNVEQGLAGISKHKGQWYPFYRLLFMLVPPVGKYLHFGRLVCSELVCKFLNKAGLDIEWHGKNPDNIHDMMKNGRDWEIIFEGKLND